MTALMLAVLTLAAAAPLTGIGALVRRDDVEEADQPAAAAYWAVMRDEPCRLCRIADEIGGQPLGFHQNFERLCANGDAA